MKIFFMHRSLRSAFGWLALAVVFAFVLLVLRCIPDIARMTAEFRAARVRMVRASELWSASGLAAAPEISTLLGGARRSFVRAGEIADSLPLLPSVPIIREPLIASRNFADIGASWVVGGETLAKVAIDAQSLVARYADRSFVSLTPIEQAELLSFGGETISRARTALDAFARADTIAARTNCPFIFRFVRVGDRPLCRNGTLNPALIPPEVEAVRRDIAAAVATADTALAFASSNEPRTALLLYLNNTEIRPGGGFLGTYGIASFARGALVNFQTDDVYNLDRRVEGSLRIPPPEPFRRYGIVDWWYLRDANWSPDFAESSRKVLDFYRQEGGAGNPAIIVGFTPAFADALLRIAGPITVGGVVFDVESAIDVLEYEVEKGYYVKGIPRPQRKAIIEPLSRAVVDRLLVLPFRRWPEIAEATLTAINERQLMAYADDAALQKVIEQFDVGGRLRALAPGEDGLLVVDANLGALKTDPMIERSIHYAFTPAADGGFQATVNLHYRNTGTFTWKTTRYRTYTRVYFPLGTEIVGVSGAMVRDRSNEVGPFDVETEFGRVVVGGFLSIEPGEERSLAIEARLAPDVVTAINQGKYRLIAPKQLGSAATPLTVDLDFGKPVVVADPPEPPAAWGDSRYFIETDLRVDREFTVNF
ncbi:MAG: DUF4012 domain-containing protein [Candidatus Uhrbacteria bacterium]